MSIGRVPGDTGIQPSIVDAKGDLIVATAADSVDRLAVGSANQVLTVDSSTATGLKWATPASGGKVLQVVMGTLTGITSTTSSTLVDLGLSVSITPSATTSKVLVIAGVNNIAKNSGNVATAMKLSLLRGATSIMVGGDRNGFNNTNVYSNVASATLNYLDSPSTTSATTYKIQFASSVSGQGVYVNDYDSSNTAVSTIIALEIGA